jgi:hypothetical protein
VGFELVKFRTMRPPDAERVMEAEQLTAVARLLHPPGVSARPSAPLPMEPKDGPEGAVVMRPARHTEQVAPRCPTASSW